MALWITDNAVTIGADGTVLTADAASTHGVKFSAGTPGATGPTGATGAAGATGATGATGAAAPSGNAIVMAKVFGRM